MKKFFDRFEELWVAVAFAEAGAYEAFEESMHVRCSDHIRIHAV